MPFICWSPTEWRNNQSQSGVILEYHNYRYDDSTVRTWRLSKCYCHYKQFSVLWLL